jgi:hypothetical protein
MFLPNGTLTTDTTDSTTETPAFLWEVLLPSKTINGTSTSTSNSRDSNNETSPSPSSELYVGTWTNAENYQPASIYLSSTCDTDRKTVETQLATGNQRSESFSFLTLLHLETTVKLGVNTTSPPQWILSPSTPQHLYLWSMTGHAANASSVEGEVVTFLVEEVEQVSIHGFDR